jgi:nitroimidazol reductase NimA-like FMN-containing flavoprotein (pyridoxamine 5'-phosphate oxidase superfamily)
VGWIHPIEELSSQECWRLLGTVPVGRLVYVDSGVPVAHPVNFVKAGSDVIIRTGPGGNLRAAERGDMVAFQADEIDTTTRAGWSVLLTGRASVIQNVDDLVAVLEPHTRPWARGRGEHVLRVNGERITGRRLNLKSA